MTFSEVMGVVIATAVTMALRWAAHRWPLDSDDDPKPRKRRPRKS